MMMRIPHRLVQRVCVWFSMQLGRNPKETLAQMQQVFTQTCYKPSTVYKWHASFWNGRTKLGDLMRHGAPQRACTRHRIRQCRTLVDGDRRIRVHPMSRTLGISYGSTLRLLHKDLNLKKKSAKLVPHQLTAEHRHKRRHFCQDFLRRCRRNPGFQSSVVTCDEAWFYLTETRTKEENKQWITPHENRPQEPRRPRNCKKLMVLPFFDRRGLVHLECLHNTTVNARVFFPIIQSARDSLFHRRIQIRCQPNRALLHMDNAPAHRAKTVQDWLRAIEWIQLAHPPLLA